jgi:perosamine synthetase
MIRLTIPSLEEDDFQAVRDVLETGYLVQGPSVAAFEADLAAYLGVTHAIAVSNCTAALHLSLMALGVGRGDRVAVTAYSWPATANVIVLCGAEPVFVDIDPATYNMAPAALEQALARQPVKAVMPVHTFGNMADMPRILDIAEKHGVPVVEDAACALGAEMNGRKAGAWGAMGCFSFHPRKAITTGEGGLVVTQDASLARRVRVLRNHGVDPDSPTPDFIAAGYNLRMTEFQGALGRSQFRKLDRILSGRQAAAEFYDRSLCSTPLQLPKPQGGSRHIYQSYSPLLPQALAPYRMEIIRRLKEAGIEATIGTYAIPFITFFRQRGGYVPEQFPATADIATRALSLPIYESITATDQHAVVAALQNVMATC